MKTQAMIGWVRMMTVMVMVMLGIAGAGAQGITDALEASAFGEAGVATVNGVKMTASPATDFDFDAETKTITGYHGPGGDVVIPDLIVVYGGDVHYPGNPVGGEAYHGVIVREIGINAFRNNTGIRTIVVPDGVWTVNNYAFGYCTNLLTAVMGASLNYIGEGAFAYTGLQHLVLRCPAPPTAPANPFIGMYIYGVTLHIRAGTAGAYSAAGWGAFQAVVEDIATEVFTVCISDTIRDTIYGSAITVHDTTLRIHVIHDTVEHLVTLDSMNYKGYIYEKDTDTVVIVWNHYIHDTIELHDTTWFIVQFDDEVDDLLPPVTILDKIHYRGIVYTHVDSIVYDTTHRDTLIYVPRDTIIYIPEYKDTVIYADTLHGVKRDTIVYFRDTMRDTSIIHVPVIVYDYEYLDSLIRISAYDTTYMHLVITDTTQTPVHDTVYEDIAYIHDTLYSHDTLTIYRDTTWLDTLRIPVHDTVVQVRYVLWHDTIDVPYFIHDTIIVYDSIVEEKPVYIVLDETTHTEYVIEDELRAISAGRSLLVEGCAPGEPFALYNFDGQLLYRGVTSTEAGEAYVPILSSGTYIFACHGKYTRVVHVAK